MSLILSFISHGILCGHYKESNITGYNPTTMDKVVCDIKKMQMNFWYNMAFMQCDINRNDMGIDTELTAVE